MNENNTDNGVMEMKLVDMPLLKRIEIGDECLKHVREFVVDGLESLKSVEIGEECFRID